jgi:hypothetical protein
VCIKNYISGRIGVEFKADIPIPKKTGCSNPLHLHTSYEITIVKYYNSLIINLYPHSISLHDSHHFYYLPVCVINMYTLYL